MGVQNRIKREAGRERPQDDAKEGWITAAREDDVRWGRRCDFLFLFLFFELTAHPWKDVIESTRDGMVAEAICGRRMDDG